MKCRCGHTAEHHANKGKNPALSFCVEQCCPCEEFRPHRGWVSKAAILVSLLAVGCSVTPEAKPQPDPQCVQRCEDTRTFCLTAYTTFCRVSCSGDVSCEAACAKPNESDECGAQYVSCVDGCAP